MTKLQLFTISGSTVAVQRFLVAQAGHPGAALLFGPREIIAIEQADSLAFARHFPNPHIGMIDGNVVALGEGQRRTIFRR